MTNQFRFKLALLASAAVFAGHAWAQDATTTENTDEEVDRTLDTVVVVGSQIKGSSITGALPVTVLDADAIDAVGAMSGDELLRSIPQMGDVNFHEGRTDGGINDARGDVASVNLRSLGSGNTLVLLNGRRLVNHPGYQTENLTPVTTVNANSIPTSGVRRVEVLRDGAAAIYGTDAVGGVVNTILRDNYDGVTAELTYGGSEGTELRELEGSLTMGRDFNNGQTNISVALDFTSREGMPATDRDYAANYDMRGLVEGTPFEGDTDWDNRSTNSPWGEFQTYGYTDYVSQNGNRITSAGDYWHVQPDTVAGCVADLGNGLCADNSTQNSTEGEDRDYRYNISGDRMIYGDNDRFNGFVFLNHNFGNGVEFFGEAGLYLSDYTTQREAASSLTSADIIVPANNYWNPFGPVTFSDGSANPNRLEGLDIPDEGVANLINDYRFVDAGAREINVKNSSYRLLGGLRGNFKGWDWESALVWSEANTEDKTNRISNTLLQEALALETPEAYNPFNGGDLNNWNVGDATPSDAATIDSFVVDVTRENSTQLGMWDLRLSRPDLFSLPGGDVGIAVGTEVRYESYEDDRDPRLDGTITFTNPISGGFSGSDVLGSSPTPDSSGDRVVGSAYAELAIPLVGPDMNIPLVQNLDMQLAVRGESYDDVGSVIKPKAALGWTVFDWLKFRGSYSEGFRAPNLIQIHEKGIERVNSRSDYIKCEADLRAGRIASFDDCGRGQSVVSQREGSSDLEPEENTTYSVGAVFMPNFWDPKFGVFTLTVDYWNIEQEGVVGIFGDDNQIALDYLLRTQGSSNPLVVRADPTADDIADFAGTGLDPVGEILFVDDAYMNLLPRTIDGFDISLIYDIDDTPLGDFRWSVNAANLQTFDQDPSPEAAAIIAAQEAGEISSGFVVDGANSILRIDGNPEWRVSTSATWRYGNWGAGFFGKYVSSVLDTSATLSDGTAWEVDEWYYGNIYGQYTFEDFDNVLDGTRLRFGIRNFSNEDPPIADSSYGYLGDLHSARGRYYYASIRKQF